MSGPLAGWLAVVDKVSDISGESSEASAMRRGWGAARQQTTIPSTHGTLQKVNSSCESQDAYRPAPVLAASCSMSEGVIVTASQLAYFHPFQ